MRKKTAEKKPSEADLKRASMALDDFVWSLQRINVRQLSEAAEAFRSFLSSGGPEDMIASTYRSGNENKDFLIGVLPRLFQDKELFPQNEDITEFASAALGLDMSRAGKRSRYEIIGKIVVEMSNLGDEKFALVANALDALVDDREKLANMAEIKRSGKFSWNETIQQLIEG